MRSSDDGVADMEGGSEAITGVVVTEGEGRAGALQDADQIGVIVDYGSEEETRGGKQPKGDVPLLGQTIAEEASQTRIGDGGAVQVDGLASGTVGVRAVRTRASAVGHPLEVSTSGTNVVTTSITGRAKERRAGQVSSRVVVASQAPDTHAAATHVGQVGQASDGSKQADQTAEAPLLLVSHGYLWW
ncbi:unnamed protein product [Ilex paraguariensis]|uniref:Uncharacterized protein n=1 Tax=Ilex paraguariensis TaxID=185542 RepID=A0ABC8SJN4_9AQUA